MVAQEKRPRKFKIVFFEIFFFFSCIFLLKRLFLVHSTGFFTKCLKIFDFCRRKKFSKNFQRCHQDSLKSCSKSLQTQNSVHSGRKMWFANTRIFYVTCPSLAPAIKQSIGLIPFPPPHRFANA